MQANRLHSILAMVLTLAIGDAAAQPPGQPQPQVAAPPGQQPVGQPLLVVPSQAPASNPGPRVNPELPTVELAPLIQRVERASGKRFLLDGRLGPQIYLGGVEPNDVTYPVLLAIFRANGFATFESEGLVNVVPDGNIRFFETRVVQTDDASIPADEFVTRVLTTTNIPTAYLVPILRPLLPQAAHLASSPTNNQLIVMDRNANVQRIAAIVRALDVPGAPPVRN